MRWAGRLLEGLLSGAAATLVVFSIWSDTRPRWWPSCGPTYTVNEQVYHGETVFWLRKLDGMPWPLCQYRLDSPSRFETREAAISAAKVRGSRQDTDERVVATVP